MAIAFVQSATGSGSGSATATLTTTLNNFLVGVYVYDSASSPTLPSGWVTAIKQTTGTRSVVIAYRENAPSVSSVTFTGGTIGGALVVAEYSGVAPAAALDRTASTATASSTTVASGTTATTTQDDELLICGYAVDSTGTTYSAPTNSFDIVAQVAGGASGKACMTRRIVAAAAAYSSDITISSAQASDGAIATFRAAGTEAPETFPTWTPVFGTAPVMVSRPRTLRPSAWLTSDLPFGAYGPSLPLPTESLAESHSCRPPSQCFLPRVSMQPAYEPGLIRPEAEDVDDVLDWHARGSQPTVYAFARLQPQTFVFSLTAPAVNPDVTEQMAELVTMPARPLRRGFGLLAEVVPQANDGSPPPNPVVTQLPDIRYGETVAPPRRLHAGLANVLNVADAFPLPQHVSDSTYYQITGTNRRPPVARVAGGESIDYGEPQEFELRVDWQGLATRRPNGPTRPIGSQHAQDPAEAGRLEQAVSWDCVAAAPLRASERLRPRGHGESPEPNQSLVDPVAVLGWAAETAGPIRRDRRVSVHVQDASIETALASFQDADQTAARFLSWSLPSVQGRRGPQSLPSSQTTGDLLELSPLPVPWSDGVAAYPIRYVALPSRSQASDAFWSEIVIGVGPPYYVVAADIYVAGAVAGQVGTD